MPLIFVLLHESDGVLHGGVWTDLDVDGLHAVVDGQPRARLRPAHASVDELRYDRDDLVDAADELPRGVALPATQIAARQHAGFIL